jgi:integrin alpha 8
LQNNKNVPFAGQVFSQKLLSLRDQHKTAEGSPSDDDSYLGYSVATGEFNGDGDKADVIVGMPRGANLTGKVRHHVYISYHIISYHIISYHIISYHIIYS